MVALSVLVIDVGYGFEGVGIPLGQFEFVCGTLTRPVPPGMRGPAAAERPVRRGLRAYRVNRFRGTIARGDSPSPLPEHYLLGFDDQKLEAEGVPRQFLAATRRSATGWGRRRRPGYPGLPRRRAAPERSWWYYYLRDAGSTRSPRGPGAWSSLSLVVAGRVAAVAGALVRRARRRWRSRVVVLVAMSVFTNINLGLRYVLPIFPYVFISTGKLVPWASGLERRRAGSRPAADRSGVPLRPDGRGDGADPSALPGLLQLASRAGRTAGLGAPDRQQPRLGPGPGRPASAGSRNMPEASGWAWPISGRSTRASSTLRGEGFDWFLPPPLPGTIRPMPGPTTSRLVGPARRLDAGPLRRQRLAGRGLPLAGLRQRPSPRCERGAPWDAASTPSATSAS